jgi:hypothetical protein
MAKTIIPTITIDLPLHDAAMDHTWNDYRKAIFDIL